MTGSLDLAILCGGLVLMGTSYGLMLWQGAQQIEAEEDALVVGATRIPWWHIEGVTFWRGLESERLLVQTGGRLLELPPRMLKGSRRAVADDIVRRAGLVIAAPKKDAHGRTGGRVHAWERSPDDIAPEPEPRRHSLEEEKPLRGLRAVLATPEEKLVPATPRNIRKKRFALDDQAKRKWWGATIAGLVFGKFSKIGLVLLKFAKLGKVGPTALSMLATVWIYAQLWGWWFAVGFVTLLFVHEIGHAIIMASKGIRTSPILFIPFVGAAITLKDQLRDATV